MLPMARAGPGGAPLLTALFTATSAVCVTGLTVVDTPTYWSPFGLAAILALFQIGGFGIMTGATLLGMLAGRRLRLSARLVAHAERGSLDTADMLGVLRLILMVTLAIELAVGRLAHPRPPLRPRPGVGPGGLDRDCSIRSPPSPMPASRPGRTA